jgi:hypothetical protein
MFLRTPMYSAREKDHEFAVFDKLSELEVKENRLSAGKP